MSSLVVAGRRITLTPSLLTRHIRTRTDPADALRWARVWTVMTILAIMPLVYLISSAADGIRHALGGLALFGPADRFVALVSQPSGDLTALGFISIVVLFGFTLLAYAFTNDTRELYRQRVADLQAERIYRAATTGGTPESFVLFLRPFVSTGAYKVRVNLRTAIREYDLEKELTDAASGIGFCIGLGQSLEHLGAGRISSDDASWRPAVLALMRHAELIVMLPAARPGTQWELEQLLTRNLIAKTVFIDAPHHSVTGYRQEAEWGEVRRLLAAHGYDLPPDDPTGRVIAFGDSKTPLLVEPLDFAGPQMLRRVLRDAVALSGRSGSLPAHSQRAGLFGSTSGPALAGIILAAVAFGWLAGSTLVEKFRDYVGSSRRTATAAGEIEPRFRRLRSQYGVDLGYGVTYHFTVDGVRYVGRDTITREPRVLALPSGRRTPTTVYYEPGDPSNNHADGHKPGSAVDLIGSSVVLGSITLVAVIVAAAACGSAVKRIR